MIAIGIGIGIGLESGVGSGGGLVGTTYFVSSAGNDTNSGTSAGEPWATIDKVNAATLVPGDVVQFNGGDTFAGSIDALEQITYQSYGTGRATISSDAVEGLLAVDTAATRTVVQNLNFIGNGTTNDRHGLHFDNATIAETIRGPTVRNCTVSGYGKGGVCIDGSQAAGLGGYRNFLIDGVEAFGNTFFGLGFSGVMVVSEPAYGLETYPHKNGVISNCVSHNNDGKAGEPLWSGSGITAYECDNVRIVGCEAYENGAASNAPDGGPFGIWLFDAINSTISHCESHHNQTATGDGGGFDLDAGCFNCVIEYCYSHDNYGPGILVYCYNDPPFVSECNNNIIRFNISVNDGQDAASWAAAIRIGAGGGSNVLNTAVYNNTFVSNSATIPLIAIEGPDLTGFFANNIFSNTGAADIIKLYTAEPPIEFRGNDYFDTVTFDWNGTPYADLAAWRAATGQETDGATDTALNVDPEFTTSMSGDEAFQLSTGSGCFGTGINVATVFGVTVPDVDYFDNPVPTAGGLYSLGCCNTTVANFPAWVESLRAPSGDLPLVILDWQGAQYWANGAIEAASTDVVENGYNTFNPATAIVADEGLKTDPSSTWKLKDEFFALIASGCTLLQVAIIAENDTYFGFDYKSAGADNCWGIIGRNLPDPAIGYYQLHQEGGNSTGGEFTNSGDVGVAYQLALGASPPAELRASAQGQATVQLDTAAFADATALQNWLTESATDSYVRFHAIYAMQPSADLPAISLLRIT